MTWRRFIRKYRPDFWDFKKSPDFDEHYDEHFDEQRIRFLP